MEIPCDSRKKEGKSLVILEGLIPPAVAQSLRLSALAAAIWGPGVDLWR